MTIDILKNVKLEKKLNLQQKARCYPKESQETNKNSWKLNVYSRNFKKIKELENKVQENLLKSRTNKTKK